MLSGFAAQCDVSRIWRLGETHFEQAQEIFLSKFGRVHQLSEERLRISYAYNVTSGIAIQASAQGPCTSILLNSHSQFALIIVCYKWLLK